MKIIMLSVIVALFPTSAFANVPESGYREIRETEAGKAYADSHWDFFERTTSSSAKGMVNYSADRPEKLEPQLAYAMFEPTHDWSKGYSLVFIETRKDGVTAEEFLKHLQDHIEMVRDFFGPHGLRGYIVLANENYEVAYLNWESKEAHDATLDSEEGRLIGKDAGEFMDMLLYRAAEPLKGGDPIEDGRVYLVQ